MPKSPRIKSFIWPKRWSAYLDWHLAHWDLIPKVWYAPAPIYWPDHADKATPEEKIRGYSRKLDVRFLFLTMTVWRNVS
jgi:hypothetical protein